MLSVVLENVAAGIATSEILAGYLSPRQEDIAAALAYAAELVRQGSIDLPAGFREIRAYCAQLCPAVGDSTREPKPAGRVVPAWLAAAAS